MATQIIFTADNGTLGSELWLSDGTAGGTILLGDLLAGSGTSSASGFFDLGNGHMLFGASNGSQGRELWITDGTAAGTSLLRDIRPGSTGGFPNSFFLLAPGRALFAANDGVNGIELWVTDGTTAGTSLFKDLNPGSANSYPSAFVGAPGGKTVFTATTAASGSELWVTDGTAAGTSQLADINAGVASSSAQNFFRLASGNLLFTATSGTAGRELWVTDGTAAGTNLVSDINVGAASSSPADFVTFGSGAFFSATTAAAGKELWFTDGTTAGTTLVKDMRPGSTGSLSGGAISITVVGGRALFSANDGLYGLEPWVSDGTSMGTSLLSDLLPGGSSSTPQGFTLVPGGKVVFAATGPGTAGRELWVTDLTTAGTSQLIDLFPGTFVKYGNTYTNSSGPSFVGRLNDGRALFTAADATVGRELWVTDGTVFGTSLVKDINPYTNSNTLGAPTPASSNPASFVSLGDGRFAFTANDGLSGSELWITDGTTAGTQRAADINTITVGSNSVAPTQTRFFTDIGGGKFTFIANDGINGNELWVTDLTAAGTSLVKNIGPGANNSGPGQLGMLALGDGRAIFDAFDVGPNGRELWITDGTSAGTSLLKDINLGSGASSSPSGRLVLGPGRALLTANNGVVGNELWITDGTTAGTTLVKDINPGSVNSYASAFAAFGGGALFGATTAAEGRELWFTDGTAAGTTLVKDILPGSAGSGAAKLTVLGGVAVFTATDGVTGTELWVTDGSSGGTSLLKDIRAGATGSNPGYMAMLDSQHAVFRADDGAVGNELWVTDGTVAGTSLVKDINTGGAASGSGNVVAIGGGKGMFAAAAPGVGTELWVTDGTGAGTSMVADLFPGAGSSAPAYITPVGNGLVVFAATTTATGTELFVTDGTAAGTSLLRDFNPGTGNSFPIGFRATGDGHVLFDGTDPSIGHEPWITDGTVAGTHLVSDVNIVTLASNPSGLTLFHTNDPPVLNTAIADQTTDEDAPFSFAIPAGSFTDPNPWDATLTYTASLVGGGALPAWLTFTPATRTFSGTPANADVGTLSIRVIASDSFGTTASDVFDLTVNNTNDPPIAAPFATAVVEDATGANIWSSLLALANDDDLIYGDALTISGVDTTGTQGSVIFDSLTHTVRYVADADAFDQLATGQTATDTFAYTVQDLAGATGTATVTVTVTGIADSTISFAVRSVSDPSLGGSIDGAEGANNVAQNQITADEFVAEPHIAFQQLLAFVDSGPGGDLGGVPGADTAYNLSSVGHGSNETSFAQSNTALDPLLIMAHGRINNDAVGDLTDGIRFHDDSFGVNAGPEGESMGQWLNAGDSVTLTTTGYDGNANNLIRSASFTFDAQGASGDLVLGWDGGVIEDLNGPGGFDGFATKADTFTFNDVSDGASVTIDFYHRTIDIGGVAQSGVQDWFAAREANGGLHALTLGASVAGGAWAAKNLTVGTVAGVPVSGGGFVDSLF